MSRYSSDTPVTWVEVEFSLPTFTVPCTVTLGDRWLKYCVFSS